MDRDRVVQAFREVQGDLVARFQALEGGLAYQPQHWQREGLGGGTAMLLRGQVFEKSGVSFSAVSGGAYPIAEEGAFGMPYFAAGVSTVSHMRNPHVPAAHANIRYLEVGEQAWFGGGADLTPCFPEAEDTASFHAALKAACDTRDPGDYPRFTEWCDRYFFLEHRKSPRGVGGIFFDHLPADETTFQFALAVGRAFGQAFAQIVARRKDQAWTAQERERLEYFRGRYVEFNLIYDRGTLFGLKSGGDPDLIFMSLPPVVRW